MITWAEILDEVVKITNDPIIESTLSLDEMNTKFDNSYGATEGTEFTAWGKKYVYFPICYDGAEWVGFAPRNPCDIKTEHQGGG